MNNTDTAEKKSGTSKISPVRKSRFADDVVVQLTRLILSGEYEPGSKLPTERELSPRFSVTRTTLREALRRMEIMGLLRVRQGDGIYVLDYTVTSTLEFVKFLLENGIGLDREFLLALEETRRIFATTLIGLAAERISGESLDRLLELVENCPEDGSPELLTGDWDFLFYREIAVGAGNRVLLYILNSFRDFFSVTRRLYCRLDAEQQESLADLNAKLVAALRDGDKELAVQIVRTRMEHDEAALRSILENMDSGGAEAL